MKRAASRLSGLVLGGLLVAGPTIARADADVPASAGDAEQKAEAADQAKLMGGVGYKTGAVQQAEAEATDYSCTVAETQAPAPSPEAQHYAQLADQYKLMGGLHYKTGLVQRAEADERRAQVSADEAAARQPTIPAAAPETYPGACNANDPWMQSPDCWK